MTKKVKKEESEEIKNLENQLKRCLADYQNLERRVAEDRSNWIKLANKQLLLRLLPVLDTLYRAKSHIKDPGLDISIEQFVNALKDEGVEKIETINHNFNPEEMECVEIAQGEEGKVVEEVRAGYKLNDKVIRPAQVKVGK